MVFRVLKVSSHQTQQTGGETRLSVFKSIKQAVTSRATNGRVYDGIGRKSVKLPILNSENITWQMKCIDLPTPICEQLVGSNGSTRYLVDVFGRFSFAEYLCQLRILKVAAHDSTTG
jgi:hypothetical protein